MRKLNKQLLIFSIINIIITFILLIFCFRLNMIPIKYLIIIVILLLLFNIGIMFLLKKKQKKYKIPGIVLSVLLIIISIFGIYYISKTNDFILKSFTKKNVDINNYYLISSITLDEIKDGIIGYYENTVNIEEAKIETIKKVNANFKSYDDIYNVFKVLDKNEIQAVLIEKSLYEFLKEKDKGINLEKYNIVTVIDVEIESVDEEPAKDGDSFSIYIGGLDFTELYTDFNMIVTVNKKTGKIMLTSTPRDFYVEVPGLNGARDLLGYVGVRGINASRKAMESLYDINIDYYMKINTKSLVGLVDTLGGIEFCSDIAYTTTHATVLETYDDTKGDKLYVQKGCHKYNGIQILTIARERKAYQDGDRQRQKNCQEIMISIFNKMTKVENLTNYSKILDSVSNLYTTNIPPELVQELAKQTLDGTKWSISQQSVTGRDSRGNVHLSSVMDYVMVPNTDSVNEASLKIKMIEAGK